MTLDIIKDFADACACAGTIFHGRDLFKPAAGKLAQ
jgi:hypothetical protein